MGILGRITAAGRESSERFCIEIFKTGQCLVGAVLICYVAQITPELLVDPAN
ncbi:hypothetical protein ACRCUN_17355 [Mycobacterium sp. LTG2003]